MDTRIIKNYKDLFSFTLIWFWGNLALESSFPPLELVYEHRLYLPSVGFFMAVSIFLVQGMEKLRMDAKRKAVVKKAGLIVLVILLSVMTYRRNKVWRSEPVLLKDIIKKSPKKARPRYNLCRAYIDHGELEKAVIQCKTLLNLEPGFEGAHNNLGVAYLRQNKPGKAMMEFLEELKRNPNDVITRHNLGMAYEDQGLLEEAIVQYRRTLELRSSHPGVHGDLGNVYLKQGKTKQARAEFIEELKCNPDNDAIREKLKEIDRNEEKEALPDSR
jgi:tetratricopeptide (TPR) repeat protein